MTKVCKGTRMKEGCGKEKPIAEFQIYPNCTSSFCRDCDRKYKRMKYHDKKKNINIVNDILTKAW